VNCKNCGAPMTIMHGGNYLYCEYCSSIHFPQPNRDGVKVLGKPSKTKCPVCNEVLVTGTIADAPVLLCRTCRGIIASQSDFRYIVKRQRAHAAGPPDKPKPLDARELKRKLSCPNCAERMDTHPYYGPGNIVIDICIDCGLVWLDHGELDTIVDAPGRGRGSARRGTYESD